MANCVHIEDSFATSSSIVDASYWENVFPCDDGNSRTANKRRHIDNEDVADETGVWTLQNNPQYYELQATKRRRIDHGDIADGTSFWTIQNKRQYYDLQTPFAHMAQSVDNICEPFTFEMDVKQQELEKMVDTSPTWEDFFQFIVSQEPVLATEPDMITDTVLIVSPKPRRAQEESCMVVKGSKIRYECSICTRDFPSKRGLKIHFHSHKVRPTINQSLPMVHHSPEQPQHLHTGSKPYPCPLCDRGFSVNQDRLVHLVTETCTRADRYLKCVSGGWECTSCKKQFSSHDQARRHIRTHESGREMRCPVCQEDFTGVKVHALVRHVKDRHPEYLDDLGVKGLKLRGTKRNCHSHKSSLDINKRLPNIQPSPKQRHHNHNHTGKNSFTCPLCDRGFGVNQDRLVHLVTEACTRANSNLRAVTGGWECNTCNKVSSSRDQAERHIRTHESGRVTRCPVCSEDFTGIKGHVLVRHVKDKHPEYLEDLGC